MSRLDLGDRAAPRLERLFRRHVGLDGGFDFFGHVDDLHQHVQLLVHRLELLGERLGVEAVLDVILALGAELLQGAEADVVVGHDQAVGGDEGAGAAAVEADRRFLQMVVPRLRRVEAVFVLQMFLGRIVEEPKALIRGEVSG